MKKYLLIVGLLILVMIISGCFNTSQKENLAINDQEEIIDNQEISQSQQTDFDIIKIEIAEPKTAEEALISFFTYLSDQEFEKALLLFELDGSIETWNGLESYSLPEDRNNKAKVLQNYCEATGTCLKAKVIETKKENDETYNLVVQFYNTDGSIFVLGPCCGATEEEMPSVDKFDFEVRKINNVFRVTTAPVYRP